MLARDAYNQSARLPRVKGNGMAIKVLAIRHMREYGLLSSLSVIEWDTLVWRCLLAAELLREDLPEEVAPALPALPTWPFPDEPTTLDNRKSVELLKWIAVHGATVGFENSYGVQRCWIISQNRTIMRDMVDDSLDQRLLAMYACKQGHQFVQQRRLKR